MTGRDDDRRAILRSVGVTEREEVERVLAEATRLERRSAQLADVATSTANPRELSRVTDPASHAVSLQVRSANPKLAPQNAVEARSGRNRYEPAGPYCASTYTSIAATCPDSCPFKDNGCYAQAGASHLTMGDLDRAGRRTTGLEVTLAEAALLDSTWVRGVPLDGHRGRGRDLRLHVGGDVSCQRGAEALAAAARRFQARGGGAVWTYTHRWREIPRRAWGSISVLASCETAEEVDRAMILGYAAAITVDRFPGRKRFRLSGPVSPGVALARAIPCPFEGDGRVTCVQYRLCFDDRRLRRGRLAIAFAAHGKDADKARRSLRVLNGATP